MKRLELSCAVRPIYGSLGVKRLRHMGGGIGHEIIRILNLDPSIQASGQLHVPADLLPGEKLHVPIEEEN